MKIIVEDGSDIAIADASLVRVLVRAHVIRDRLLQDKSRTTRRNREIGKELGGVLCDAAIPSHTCLAPDLVSADPWRKASAECATAYAWTRDCSIGASNEKVWGLVQPCPIKFCAWIWPDLFCRRSLANGSWRWESTTAAPPGGLLFAASGSATARFKAGPSSIAGTEQACPNPTIPITDFVQDMPASTGRRWSHLPDQE